jgi:hypothetical protein
MFTFGIIGNCLNVNVFTRHATVVYYLLAGSVALLLRILTDGFQVSIGQWNMIVIVKVIVS